jgi:serine/threonine protein kinase, bacterial
MESVAALIGNDNRKEVDHLCPIHSKPSAEMLINRSVHPGTHQITTITSKPRTSLAATVPGELIGVERSRRADPASPFQRFRALPISDLLTSLNVVFDFHRSAAELGWVAVDFYDGAMIYDFATQSMCLIDLDNYRDQPFTNEIGRMFGSTRFMAPEEFELGAIIDEVTTVFTMGRVISVFLSDGTLELTPFRGDRAFYEVMIRACQPERKERFPSMKAFHAAWLAACR